MCRAVVPPPLRVRHLSTYLPRWPRYQRYRHMPVRCGTLTERRHICLLVTKTQRYYDIYYEIRQGVSEKERCSYACECRCLTLAQSERRLAMSTRSRAGTLEMGRGTSKRANLGRCSGARNKGASARGGQEELCGIRKSAKG